MKLFADYAKEVSDPKNRAENEAYLRQLEEEGRAEEFYGKGSQLIVPEPGFVIKTSNVTSKEKFFINVCTNTKVGPATSTKTQGGENWNIPFSLGAVHPEIDKKNKARREGTTSVMRTKCCFMSRMPIACSGYPSYCIQRTGSLFCTPTDEPLSSSAYLSLGAQPCSAADFCVFDDTLKLAKERPRFMVSNFDPVRCLAASQPLTGHSLSSQLLVS